MYNLPAQDLQCLRGPPLPEPRWGNIQNPLILTTAEHNSLVEKAEGVLRNLLCDENYDSVNSLLCFYDTYMREGSCLYNVYKEYTPILKNKKLTCVGLALELMNKWRVLDDEFPNFASSSILVSCEQDVLRINEYVSADGPDTIPKVDKEHALVCVSIKLDGRPGVILADPGYHVARVVTVMLDQEPPHTGWFSHFNTPNCHKEFYYKFNDQNSHFIEWHEKKTKTDQILMETSLIYVARPYLEGINVTIRRNLVYDFRSLLARNENGYVIAGVYFQITPADNEFTLLLDVNDEQIKTKHQFALFEEGEVIPEPLLARLTQVNTKLNLEDGELVSILRRLATILSDEPFVRQLLNINDYIQKYTRDDEYDYED